MSKREQRRKQSSGWQNAGNNMTLEEAGRLGYDLNIDEPDPEVDTLENAIVPSDDGTFIYKRFQLKPTGIIIPEDLQDEEWRDIFQVLRKLDEAIQWAVGDLVNHAESKWGETYTSMAEVTQYSEKSLREYAYVARSVDMSIRMDNLSFGHHQLVAGLKDQKTKKPLRREQAMWLQRASDNNWSIKALREAMKAEYQKQKNYEMEHWLFSKDRIPNISKRFQKLWSKAKNGDSKSEKELLAIVEDTRKWLTEVVESLDNA
ncbi:MAG: hypothetical protein AAFR81_23955 [Chloroflexota bacterium]